MLSASVEPMTCVLEIEAKEDTISDDSVRRRHWNESLADTPRAKRAVAGIDVANRCDPRRTNCN